MTTIQYSGGLQAHAQAAQPMWHRIVLLCMLAYEAAGCMLGGALLVAAPDGRLMSMPTDLMNGVFPDFLIPGIILFLLGIINTIAFIAVLRRSNNARWWAGVAVGGLLIWFWVEIAIIEELHWLHAMWGLPLVAAGFAALSLFSARAIRRGLLYCGMLSSLLYVAINIIVPMQWPAYSSVTQTVSELSAVGAPTRMLWNVLSTPYTLLVIAFAIGIRKAAGGNKLLRIAGTLLFVYGALGGLWVFAPMHLRETLAADGGTFSDTMHLTLAGITEVIYLIVLVITARALGKPFSIYSIITFIVLLVFGVLTFIEAPNVATNGPTPMIGIWERINIGVFLLWVVVLAGVLLRRERAAALVH